MLYEYAVSSSSSSSSSSGLGSLTCSDSEKETLKRNCIVAQWRWLLKFTPNTAL